MQMHTLTIKAPDIIHNVNNIFFIINMDDHCCPFLETVETDRRCTVVRTLNENNFFFTQYG